MKTGQIVTRENYSPNISALRCPRCNGEYLHHIGLIYYDRATQDAPSSAVYIAGGKVTIAAHDDTSSNPSSRRDGLSIRFQCELCQGIGEDRLELIIAQHKGITEIGWRFDPLP